MEYQDKPAKNNTAGLSMLVCELGYCENGTTERKDSSRMKSTNASKMTMDVGSRSHQM